MQGLHLIGDLGGCACPASLLTDVEVLAPLCREATLAAELTLINEQWHRFPPCGEQAGGVTGVLLLAESHLAVHTWPEKLGVTLDVYVCNVTGDNSAKARQLFGALLAAFQPASRQVHEVMRGERGAQENAMLMLEWLTPHAAYGVTATRWLADFQSPYQHVEVFDTPQFGKLFRLDGHYMTSERDEFFYHECLVHPAALAHPAPRSALVIGGGDGGSSEELLKHGGMERVLMVELDAAVIEIARRHLRGVHHGVFDDPRLEVRIGDGFEFARQSEEQFDLVLLDLTDPDTPAQRLYTRAFFSQLQRILKPGGAISLHIGAPVFQPDAVRRLLTDLRAVFAVVRPLTVYVPLYGTLWGMAVASDSLDPLALTADACAERLRDRGVGGLQYYNPEVHSALFALPTFVQALLE